MDILTIVVTAIIVILIGIIFKPVRDWFYSKNEEYCAFMRVPGESKTLRPIIVTKTIGKTKQINCTWFKERENKEFNGKQYLHCDFGKPLNNAKRGGKCPFA